MERHGLVGAMPVGNRWRAQGYIDGTVRYLGTFDTEEEAHAVFAAEKARSEAERNAEVQAEYERLLASPTWVYQGGVGRGAALNGQRFKVFEQSGSHATVVPVMPDGTLVLGAGRRVLCAYLVGEPSTPMVARFVEPVRPTTEERADDVTVAPDAAPGVRDDVLRFLAREDGHDAWWAFEFLGRNARGQVAETLAHIRGDSGIAERLEWLRTATTVPSGLLDGIERDQLDGVFDTKEIRRQARVAGRVFGGSSA